MAEEQRPRILYFKEFIPTSVCIFLSLFFAMVFQFNGGVFLPTSVQMSSALGCLKEDVMMAGYASFIGMTVIFPILFRLKFRFTTRQIFMMVCPVLICCNLVTMHVQNIFILVVTCFISGFSECGVHLNVFKYPFECNPLRKFFRILSGNLYHCTRKHPAFRTCSHTYQRLGKLAIHALARHRAACCCMVMRIFLTRPFRMARKMPLYGIDWTSALLWAVVLFSIVFVCIYGEYYDWLDSALIRGCIVLAVVCTLINVNRMFTTHRPYIHPHVFKYRHFPTILFLFLMLCLFLTTSSVLQEMFMSAILKYDMLNAVSLNWCVFIGILAGAGVVFYRQVVLRKGYKLLITVGFMLIVVYQYYMYFLIHPNLNIESLYIPNFLKGLGHGILYISLTIYVAKTVPFEHFFQGLCVLSFIRTSIATPLGTAILNRWLKYMQQDNIGLISRKMDLVKEWMPDVSIQQLYEEVTRQTLLTSLKELFGAVCIVGTIFLLFLLSQKVWRKLLRYVRRNHPRYIQLLKRSQPAQ